MDPQARDYLCLQAWIHLRYQRVVDAIVILEGLAVLTPGDAWVHRTLSYAYLRNEDFQLCLEQQNHLLAQKSSTDRLFRVRALWGLGQKDEARRLVKELGGRLTKSQ